MSQKPIREALVKKLINDNWPQDMPGKPEIKFAEITPETDMDLIPSCQPWLNEGMLVAKPDELFGKRGKLGYVKIAENFESAKEWIKGFRGKEVMVGKRIGRLDHFLIEPFILCSFFRKLILLLT